MSNSQYVQKSVRSRVSSSYPTRSIRVHAFFQVRKLCKLLEHHALWSPFSLISESVISELDTLSKSLAHIVSFSCHDHFWNLEKLLSGVVVVWFVDIYLLVVSQVDRADTVRSVIRASPSLPWRELIEWLPHPCPH